MIHPLEVEEAHPTESFECFGSLPRIPSEDRRRVSQPLRLVERQLVPGGPRREQGEPVRLVPHLLYRLHVLLRVGHHAPVGLAVVVGQELADSCCLAPALSSIQAATRA